METIARGMPHVFLTPVISQADTKIFKTGMTIAADDVKLRTPLQTFSSLTAEHVAFTSGSVEPSKMDQLTGTIGTCVSTEDTNAYTSGPIAVTVNGVLYTQAYDTNKATTFAALCTQIQAGVGVATSSYAANAVTTVMDADILATHTWDISGCVGGMVAITPVITGQFHGHYVGAVLTSGTWGAGTAAGALFLEGVTGVLISGTLTNTSTATTDVLSIGGDSTVNLMADVGSGYVAVPVTSTETAVDGTSDLALIDAAGAEWCNTGIQFETKRDEDDIVCAGVVDTGGAVGAFTLERVNRGALTNVQVNDIVKVAGLPGRAIKTYNSGTGAVTCDALISDPSGLKFIVFGSAPLDAAVDFSTTQKTSLDTAADSVLLANGAHGGAAATLTLLSGVINNTGGVGLAITGTTIGLDVNASAGVGVDVDGTTGGITSTASAGVGMTVTGSTTALGIHGASTGIDLDASAGIGVDLDGTTFGMCIDGSAGPGLSVSGTTMGLDLNASAGPAADIDGTTFGLDIAASAGDGVQIVGTTADIDSDVTGAASGNATTAEIAAVLAKCLVGVKKNTALANFPFVMRDSSTHLPKTGLTVSGFRSLDGAAYAATATATATEVSNGSYKLSLAAADLNATTVILRFTATGADDLFVTILTEV